MPAFSFSVSGVGGGGGSPGGSNTQVQFNNAGVFGGTTGLEFDSATPALRALNTFTGGFRLFNSTDVLTNTEFLRISCGSNIGLVGMDSAGSGVQREMAIGTFRFGLGRNRLRFFPGGSATEIQSASIANAIAGSVHFLIAPGNFTATSGNQTALSVTPTINQSGAASYLGMNINIVETSTGSGDKSAFQTSLGGVVQFQISNTGRLRHIAANSATTVGAAGAAAALPATPTGYLIMEVAGVPQKFPYYAI